MSLSPDSKLEALTHLRHQFEHLRQLVLTDIGFAVSEGLDHFPHLAITQHMRSIDAAFDGLTNLIERAHRIPAIKKPDLDEGF